MIKYLRAMGHLTKSLIILNFFMLSLISVMLSWSIGNCLLSLFIISWFLVMVAAGLLKHGFMVLFFMSLLLWFCQANWLYCLFIGCLNKINIGIIFCVLVLLFAQFSLSGCCWDGAQMSFPKRFLVIENKEYN